MSFAQATRSAAVRVSAALLVVAIGITARSIADALRPAAIPVVPQSTIASLDRLVRTPPPAPADIQAAVENDVFASDRTAPSAPYRMPGDRDQTDAPAVEPVKPLVLGTAVATDGRSFATMQLGDAGPVLVRVGERIGEWTVKAIGRGTVTLVADGGARADLSVLKPGT